MSESAAFEGCSGECVVEPTDSGLVAAEPVSLELVAPAAPFARELPVRSTAGDWILLIMCGCVTVLAFLMSVRGEEQVIMPIANEPLPGLCTFKNWTGWDCPGCGMTRAFICFAHGDLVRAWYYNPAALYFFPLVVMQVPLRIWQIWRVRRGEQPIEFGRWGLLPMFALLALVFGQWLVRSIILIAGA